MRFPAKMAFRTVDLSIDHRVMTYTLGVSVLSGILFGLIPAIRGAMLDLNQSLKAGGRPGGDGFRLRGQGLLLVSDVGLAMVLLVGAGLMINSFVRLRKVDLGFNPRNVLRADVFLDGPKFWHNVPGQVGYMKEITPQSDWFFRDLLERLGFRGDVAYVWHAGVHAVEAAVSLQKAGFDIRSQIIWAKQHFVISRGNYHWQHEPCWYAVRKGKSSRWRGDRTQSTLWEVPNLNPFAGGNRDEAATGHGTQKPIELVRRAVLNHTERGEAVYDPFLGSGTTLVAAELTGRAAYGLDIDPHYVDLTIHRWEQLTGRQATLAGDGHTFDQVSVARGTRGEAPKVTSADESAEEPSLGAA